MKVNIKTRFMIFINSILTIVSPVFATKFIYRINFRKKLDIKNPQNFNEKIQYLKLNDYFHNDQITQCIDKFKVREYINKKGLGVLLPKLYGVYRNTNSIVFEELPNSFVIKCNHGSGYNILCRDRKTLDVKNTKKTLNKWMKENYWRKFAEVQYCDIEKRIIIEEYLGKPSVIKIYCFNGVPQILYSCIDDGMDVEKIAFYDINWNKIDIKFGNYQQGGGYRRKTSKIG